MCLFLRGRKGLFKQEGQVLGSCRFLVLVFWKSCP